MNKKNWLIAATTAILLLMAFLPVIASAAGTITVTKYGVGDVVPLTYNPQTSGGTVTVGLAPSSTYRLTTLPDSNFPMKDYMFSGWAGDCSGVGACVITTDSANTKDFYVTATFVRAYTLTLKKVGNGAVTGLSGKFLTNINTPVITAWDGSNGTVALTSGTIVILTATPDTGWVFDGWDGGCSGTGVCSVTMTENKNVVANFTIASNVKTILKVTTKAIDEGGNVVSSNKGSVNGVFTCNFLVAPCLRSSLLWSNNVGTITFDNSGWVAVLTATPDSGYVIEGWNFKDANGNPMPDNPSCSKGSGTCRLTMTESKNVIAMFKEAPAEGTKLTVLKDGGTDPTKRGRGILTGMYKGPTTGGADVRISFSWSVENGNEKAMVTLDDTNAIVTLNATPASGNTFDGWEGDCTGSGSCVFQMTADKNITANFSRIPSVATSILHVRKYGYRAEELFTGGMPQPPNPTPTPEPIYANGSIEGTATEVYDINGNMTSLTEPILFTWGLDESASKNPISEKTFSSAGTTVKLLAAPDTGYKFVGWSGACSGTGPCNLTLTSDKDVAAIFQKTPTIGSTVLKVTKKGKGSVTGTHTTTDLNECGGSSVCTTYIYWSGNPPEANVSFDNSGKRVTLKPEADTGYTFTGWSGHCSGKADCVMTMTENKDATATFTSSNPAKLTVFKAGSGSGTVTASPVTLSWSNNIGTASCDPNDTITLTATPTDANSIFVGWTGDCLASGTNPTCQLSMSSLKNVTATFKSTKSFDLTVTKTGIGTGTVTVSSGSLQWTGNTGTASYPADTSVTLTATADAGSVFNGWSGDCPGIDTTCSLTMSAAKNVTATFVSQGTLTVTKAGTGTGTITVSSGSLTWTGNTGTAIYAEGKSVTLTATADTGSYFTAWSGDCTGTSTTCTLSVSSAKNVTATFDHRYTLTVAKDGDAADKGTVAGSPGTLTWNGNTGSATYTEGQSVTLTATAPDGVTFTDWSGDGTGTAPTRTLIIYKNSSVKATFKVGYQMAVNMSGSGEGSVTVSMGTLKWSGEKNATAIYNSGVPVTLTATPATGSTFDGWLGDCQGKELTCSVTMFTAKSITAMFTSATAVSRLPNRDFDGDGKSDLLWRNAVTGDVYVWLMSGTSIAGGDFVARGIPEDWSAKATGDFDGDGKSDVLWQNTTTGDVAVWLMDGTKIRTGAYITRGIPGEWTLTALGDFDGDGKTDIMWRDSSSGDIYVWLMNGASIAGGGYIVRGMPSDWSVKAVADLNGDGKSDVLWQNSSTGDVAAWLMNGLSVSTANNIALGIGSNWQIKAVEDFNGDGKADIAWQDVSSGDIFIWLMNGLEITDRGYAARGIQRNWQLKTTGDYRGNGKTDMLWQNSSTGDVYIWFMDGLNVTGGGYAATGLPNDWQLK
ncbi:cell wall/surface repeat-containing protein [Candidatus Magnetobacterium bavaricum]|uniref:Cell wall/surface repeat-containing protein n=1 Tax=Candidatus Magnetobacterium bavaricum TaxID=29290 RepID=A0A0F3GLK3_9BACT|nr:cell wall/surface repeat-containing protein [Candidatus Magnetobacterium bavaricum]